MAAAADDFAEPLARSAVWSRRLGLFGVAVTLVALGAWRSGAVERDAGFAALGAGLVLALLAALLAAVAAGTIWARGLRGAGSALVGLLAGLAVLALPAAGAVRAWSTPAIADVTTDPSDPPAFVFAAADRRPGDADPAYPGPRLAMAQLAAYPDIQPLDLSLSPGDAYAAALRLVRSRGWRILDDGSGGPAPHRRIEAVARTRLLGVAEDVVVRIRPEAGGSRIDMRSAARLPWLDLGSAAARVQQFLADLAAAAP